MRAIKIKFVVIIFISLIFSRAIFGATICDDVPDSDYVALGNDLAFDAVGTFTANLTGSGILIAPDWVLTAAHLILGASSATFTIEGTTYTSSQIFTDPSWNGNDLAGSDFSLVHLSSSVTAIPPANLYSGPSIFGDVGTFVGYGFHGTGLTGWSTLDGQKRAFQNVIDGDIGNPAFVLLSDFDNPHSPTNNAFGDATPLPLEGCVAPGDSGGGFFVQNGSQFFLAGIISFVAATTPTSSANSIYGNASGFDPISSALPWIDSVVPEPSPTELISIAGIIFFAAKKFRRPKI